MKITNAVTSPSRLEKIIEKKYSGVPFRYIANPSSMDIEELKALTDKKPPSNLAIEIAKKVGLIK